MGKPVRRHTIERWIDRQKSYQFKCLDVIVNKTRFFIYNSKDNLWWTYSTQRNLKKHIQCCTFSHTIKPSSCTITPITSITVINCFPLQWLINKICRHCQQNDDDTGEKLSFLQNLSEIVKWDNLFNYAGYFFFIIYFSFLLYDQMDRCTTACCFS